MKIAITTSTFAQYSKEPLELLEAKGIEYVLNPHGRALTEDETIELLRNCVAVAAGTEPLSRRVLDVLPDLQVISRCGTGMDSVDQDAAREKGIAVCNTPDGPTQAVVELTLGYALSLVRQTCRMNRELCAGTWKKRMGGLLQGKRVGIIGYGRIGSAVARMFTCFGCECAFHDPFLNPEASHEIPSMELDDLLRWADMISLHCARPKDGPILTAKRLALLREGCFVLNAARGGLLDENALYELLRSGHLAGAALDVFEHEPYTGPLASLDTVILTPHIGSYAKEARIRMEIETIRNLLAALETKEKACRA